MLRLDRLESRILFSATPIDVTAVVGGEDAGTTVDQVESWDSPESSVFDAEPPSTVVEASPREIAVIDGNVDGLQQLLDDLDASQRNVEVFVLDSQRDGIDQITEILEGRADVDSLHIVSHGSGESMSLGSLTLTERNLDAYAGQIASWKNALSNNADILLYGCNLAGTETGLEFVESLSVLTDTDVAASDDLTGHASLGGDWEFEIQFARWKPTSPSARNYNSSGSPSSLPRPSIWMPTTASAQALRLATTLCRDLVPFRSVIQMLKSPAQ